MNKLEQPKGKHDHKWTDILKVCIFSILMIAPFIAILSKIIYVSANKNAKESYYGETINQEQEETINIENFRQNVEYTIYTPQDIQITNGNIDVFTNTVQVNETLYDNNVSYIRFYTQNNGTIAIYKTDQSGISYLTNVFTNSYYLKLKILRYEKSSNATGTIKINYTTYNEYSYLDNVFYYAVDQMKNNQLFKWVDTTIVFNGLNAMNTGFGLPGNHVITYLLAYWTILTAIYIIVDIILFLFTKLTHMLQ